MINFFKICPKKTITQPGEKISQSGHPVGGTILLFSFSLSLSVFLSTAASF
jgi:hypothetical protein